MGLPVIAALGMGTMPARALPAASMQLIRINGNGVKPMPAITDALDRAQVQRDALAKASAAPEPVGTTLKLVAQSEAAAAGSLATYTQSFVGPLPALEGNLRVVFIDPNTGLIGDVLAEIPVTSSNVVISPDRLQLTINLPPGSGIQAGQKVMVQLPSTTPTGSPIIYPNHLAATPCQFTVTAAAATSVLPVAPLAAAPLAAAPVAAAAAAGISPLVIIVGVVLVGVGVAAAAGAFSSGDGGTNTSSQ